MDTLMTSLPPNVGAILMENISIIQIVSMFSIGAYNALETGIVTFDTFKRYRGLYFWSMQFASWGILVHAIPAMARFISGVQPLDIHPLHDRMVRHGYRPSCRPLLASAPRFLRHEKGAVGSMDDHYKRLHPTYPNDRFFLRPQPRRCTLCSPCRDI
jgi:hypothetical protein